MPRRILSRIDRYAVAHGETRSGFRVNRSRGSGFEDIKIVFQAKFSMGNLGTQYELITRYLVSCLQIMKEFREFRRYDTKLETSAH
jgi:hypothetical protein